MKMLWFNNKFSVLIDVFGVVIANFELFHSFKRQPHKLVKYTQTICRQFADKLFECVWPFCGVGTKGFKVL